MKGQAVEMVASHCPPADEPEAYERLLEEAMVGDTTMFAREDYVEEAWRIVDPFLKTDTAVYEYEPNSWGPAPSIRRSHPLAAGATLSSLTIAGGLHPWLVSPNFDEA